MILLDLYQQGQINAATSKAEQAKRTSDSMQKEIEDLKRKSDALTIACQALWEIVRSQSQLADRLLLKKMEEIDLRDGRADGKISMMFVECRNCGRKSNSVRKGCLYCGAPLPPDPHVFAQE